MPVRLALISFSCLSVFGCTPNTIIKSTPDIEVSKNLTQTAERLIVNKKQSSNKNLINADYSVQTIESSSKKEWLIDNNESNQDSFQSQKITTAPSNLGSYMTLKPTGRENALGNPLYELRLYADGKPVGEFITVTGRKDTQTKNRHQAGTQAPLPNGKYTVARQPIPATIPEAGKLFLPIEPLFPTGRTSLGIHYDPSFEKDYGEDGTSGCIGLTKVEDLEQVLDYVRTSRPEYLEVQI